jgi:hypothetical protein
LQQGNAYALSRDLAESVAAISERPWFKLIADDITVGLLMDAQQPRYVEFRADIQFDTPNTPCTAEADHHFNVSPEAMYALFRNHKRGLSQCHAIGTLSPLQLDPITDDVM